MKLSSPTAAMFVAQGNEFDPDLHFNEGTQDAWAMQWLTRLVENYDRYIIAHHLAVDSVTGFVSLELQFGADDDSRRACDRCNKEYCKGPPKRPKLGFDEPRIHQRLFNYRFYLLPDRRPFVLLGKWDRHGNRWGKVQAGPALPDGSIPLKNEMAHEEVLRRCPLIPKEDWPFAYGRNTESNCQ